MSDRHWDGNATYCHPEEKVALGFVERLSNKFRALRRRAHGLRDEDRLSGLAQVRDQIITSEHP